MDSLTPAKKAQLHEVADLMLEIYRTLVRMRYLEASWICEEPHDIEALLPMYRSYGLDDAVIYLYSILPYVDTAGAACLDFFQGGEFVDFRKEEAVKQGRDPFYEENEDDLLPPHMTPLSLLGNHHMVWDEEGEGEQEQNGVDEDEAECDGSDEEAEDEDEGDGSDGEGAHWDEMSSRPAGRVLRDIVRWYHELIETPGGGEQSAQSGGGWEPEILKPLYQKHGWPDSRFDGDAFLVDLARADASRTVEGQFTGKLRQLKTRLELDGPGGPRFARMKETEAAAETAEDLWVARWHLWRMELDARLNADALRRAEKRWEDARRGGLALKEVAALEESLDEWERRLGNAQRELRDVEAGNPKDVPGAQIRLQYAEKQVGIFKKACEASRADADALLPEGTCTPGPRALKISGYEEWLQQLDWDAGENQRKIESIQEWISQLPGGIDRARKLAWDAIAQKEEALIVVVERRRWVAEDMEKLKSEEGEEG